MATARKLPSGSWRVRVFLGKNESGKESYKSFTAPTKKEAEFLAAQFYAERREVSQTGMTVAKAIESYIELKSGVLSPSTLLGYKRQWRNCYDSIANTGLDDLTQAQIQRWISEFASGRSPKYVSNAWGLLSSTIKMFRPEFSPHVTLPQKRKNPVPIPLQSEIDAMRAAISGSELELPFLLATQCGLRASEIAALRTSDFDAKALTVKIDKARVAGEYGPQVKAPKSYAGYRTLPCSTEIISLVSKTETDQIYLHPPGVLSSSWSKFVRSNDFTAYNFHALRHYFASRAALLGIPKEYLVELMGHSSSKMLDQIYLHTFSDAKAAFADRLRQNMT